MTTTTVCDHESIVFTDSPYGRYPSERRGYCEDCGVDVRFELDYDDEGVYWDLYTEGDNAHDAAVEDAMIERGN